MRERKWGKHSGTEINAAAAAVIDDGGRHRRRRVRMLVVRPRQTALSARRYLSVFFEEERYIGGTVRVREQSRG